MGIQSLTHLLLVCHTFPPYAGIGGRRWAKFAKYLSRKGYVVHVICSENPFNENSLWGSDVESNPRIILYPLPVRYPVVLQTRPGNFLQRLSYFSWVQILRLLSKGTIYDKSLFWKKQFLRKADELIRVHRITNVIVTGAPFNLAYFTCMLKEKHGQIRVITDLRDPWTWGQGYGYASLPPKKINFEKEKERYVIDRSDYITVPAQVMKDHLSTAYPGHEKKIILLPHAFDKDEIARPAKSESSRLRLVFYGTLYDHLTDYMLAIAEVMKQNRGKVKLDIYSDSNRYRGIFNSAGLDGEVSYFSALHGRALFSKLGDYDYVLLIYPDYALNYLSTKFFEIIESRTPFLYVANYGSAAEFIIKNKLGIYLPPPEIRKGFQKVIDYKQMPDYNFKYDNSAFSFSGVTEQLEKLFVKK